MNVTFHTFTALAAASVLSSKRKLPIGLHRSDTPWLALGLVVGVLTHGLLDYMPHAYPIPSLIDVALSLALFSVTLLVAPQQWLILGACFLGTILPDIVDLGPQIVNKRLGWTLPVIKVFPWHWPQYSGSIYDGGHATESFLYHLLTVGVSVSLLWTYRSSLLRRRQLRRV